MFWGQALIEFRRTDKARVLAEFPRLALKNGLKKSAFATSARRKPESTFDNIVPGFRRSRYVEGYTSPNFADVVANAPFSE